MSAGVRSLVVLAGVLVLFASQDRAESQVGSPDQPIAINEFQISDSAAPGSQFVELFNVSSEPVFLSGWTLQSWRGIQPTASVQLSGMVPPRGYFLIATPQFVARSPLSVPDALSDLNMSATGGSLVLLRDNRVSDTVGWGSLLGGPVEGAPARSPLPGQSAERRTPGFDTDNNSADFQTQFIPSPTNSTSVQEPNLPPVFNPVPFPVVSEGALLTFIVTASDPEGGLVTLAADVLPPGATFDPVTGVFSWVPSYGAAGTGTPYFASFIATDDRGLRSGLTVQIKVFFPTVTMSITSPTSNPTYATPSSSVVLSGTLTNAPAVQSVSWSNAATGVKGGAAGISSWSAQVPLKAGDNAIQISALGFGADGVLGTASILVTYTPPGGGILLTAPAQVSARMLALNVSAEVATIGDVGTVYFGGQVLVLAPDGSVRDNTAITPVLVSNGSRLALSYAQKTAFGKAKPGDSLVVTATLTGLKGGLVTFKAAEAAVVKVVP